MQAARRGTRETGLEFEDFFEAEYRRLGKALYVLTGNRAEAEDVAQEAMARVWERWARVRDMTSPAGYLFKVALNLQRRRWRHLRRQTQTAARLLPSARGTVREGELREAVAALTLEQRQALVLVEFLGFDAGEAGRLLGIDAASVRGRLHRARATLRERLGDGDD